MSTYTARATREQGWWTVEVDEVPGLFTQARRLSQIEAQVRDALTLFPEIESNPDDARVIVVPMGEYAALADRALQARRDAETAKEQANRIMVETARDLYRRDLPYRDIGQLLGVSFQRAAQLVAG